jgi:addiction module RelB/DinJ family antitoxin
MTANAVVRARIDERIKDEASAILSASGLTVSDAVRMLLVRTVAERGLPFAPLAPDEAAIAAHRTAPSGAPSIESLLSDIAALCRRFRVSRLDLFGSAATGAFDPATSDVDLLVSFDPAVSDYAGCFFGLLEGLEELFGRPVDLVTEQSIANPYLRRQIMAERRPLFRSGDSA